MYHAEYAKKKNKNLKRNFKTANYDLNCTENKNLDLNFGLSRGCDTASARFALKKI